MHLHYPTAVALRLHVSLPQVSLEKQKIVREVHSIKIL